MKRIPFMGPVLWSAGVLLAAWLGARVDPQGYAGGRSRDEEERARRNSSSLATMLGEFRTGVSDIMFIKTERYLHAGVGYVAHHDVLSAEDLSAEVDEHQSELGMPEDDDDDHAGTATLIPPPDRDFRGIVGRLHREVKPWRDPGKAHVHTDGRELLPWFRVMTLSDPNYVRGYVAGGFWLQIEDLNLALDFIEEGLRNNPGDFQLYVSRGFLRVKQARAAGDTSLEVDDLEPNVRAALELARDDFRRAAERVLDVRPDDVNEEGFGSGGWGRYHESDAMAAVGMAVSLTRNLGDPAAARDLAREYLRVFPDFAPLQRALEP